MHYHDNTVTLAYLSPPRPLLLLSFPSAAYWLRAQLPGAVGRPLLETTLYLWAHEGNLIMTAHSCIQPKILVVWLVLQQ